MSNKVILVKCFAKFVLTEKKKVSITNEISFELSNHFDQSQQEQTAP